MTTTINDAALRSIYQDGAAAQRPRYQQAIKNFAGIYGPGDIYIFRAPGRVNLIGEHTDYNNGFVMPVALDKDVLLLARPRPDNYVRLANVEAEFQPFSFAIEPEIPPGAPGAWENYAKGAAQLMAQHLERQLTGFDGLVVGQSPQGVPRGAGLSSSTSLTVVAAIALAHFNNWQPDEPAFAQFCSRAEWYVGTRGGVLDQFSLLLTRQGHALFLDCRPAANGRFTMEHVPLPNGYRLMVANSGVHHRNVGGGYNRRVAECRAGVSLLQNSYPNITSLRDMQPVPWTEFAELLPPQTTVAHLRAGRIDLGDLPGLTADTPLKVRARCRHVWSENERVTAAAAAMRAGNIAALGRYLNQAHASARDDYEISCAELESLVTAAREVAGVVGARLTGAGWGGCIVALVAAGSAGEFETHVSRRYQAETGLQADIFTCRAGPGAGLVAVVANEPMGKVANVAQKPKT